MSDTRSGSTLLQNILSTGAQMTTVGELFHLDSFLNKGHWGRTWNWQCTCGEPFESCEFWGKILGKLRDMGVERVEATEVQRKNAKGLSYLSSCEYRPGEANDEIIRLLEQIYTAVFELTGASVIVDSSKDPTQGLALYEKLGYDVKIIYLKRDIRAVTMSKHKWFRKLKERKPGRYKIMLLSKLYDLRCTQALERINESDKIFIRYEDLARRPQAVIDHICDSFQLHALQVPDYMVIERDHAVGGTPNRQGKRKIEYDDSWKKKSASRPIFRLLGSVIDKI